MSLVDSLQIQNATPDSVFVSAEDAAALGLQSQTGILTPNGKLLTWKEGFVPMLSDFSGVSGTYINTRYEVWPDNRYRSVVVRDKDDNHFGALAVFDDTGGLGINNILAYAYVTDSDPDTALVKTDDINDAGEVVSVRTLCQFSKAQPTKKSNNTLIYVAAAAAAGFIIYKKFRS
jgi:hypothetical protein